MVYYCLFGICAISPSSSIWAALPVDLVRWVGDKDKTTSTADPEDRVRGLVTQNQKMSFQPKSISILAAQSLSSLHHRFRFDRHKVLSGCTYVLHSMDYSGVMVSITAQQKACPRQSFSYRNPENCDHEIKSTEWWKKAVMCLLRLN